MSIRGKLKAGVCWFKARLNERSTLAGVTGAISAAAVLPYPWSVASFCVGCAIAFIPDGKVAS